MSHAEPAGVILSAILDSGASGLTAERHRRVQMVADAVKAHSGQPPLRLPELMKLLHGVAEGQIAMAIESQQRPMLEDAITFARWLKMPPAVYGAAREKFREQEREREAQQRVRERREALGVANGVAQKAAIRSGAKANTKFHSRGVREAKRATSPPAAAKAAKSAAAPLANLPEKRFETPKRPTPVEAPSDAPSESRWDILRKLARTTAAASAFVRPALPPSLQPDPKLFRRATYLRTPSCRGARLQRRGLFRIACRPATVTSWMVTSNT